MTSFPDHSFGRAMMPHSEAHEKAAHRSSVFCRKFYLRSRDDFFIHTTMWVPAEAPKGVVVYVHGYGDHANSSIFGACQDNMTSAGYIIIAPDMPGHGKSTGVHGQFADIDHLVNAVDAAVEFIRGDVAYAHLTLCLYGASLGGLVSLHYALKMTDKIDGLSVACPLIRPHGNSYPHWFTIKVAQVLNFLSPWTPIAEGGHGRLTADPALEDKWYNDPLVYGGGMRVGAGLAMRDAVAYMEQNMHKISLPLMIQHGEDDRVVDPAGSRALFAAAATKQKVLKMYPKMQHAFPIEKGSESCMRDLVDWMNERSAETNFSLQPQYNTGSQ